MAIDISANTGTAALGGAVAGASFGPVGMAVGAAAAIGFQLWGASQSHSASQRYNQAQRDQIAAEMEIQRRQLEKDELMASRMKTENLRALQQKSALGLQAFISQGGGDIKASSALGGSRGQQRGEAGWNELGINQSLYFARDIFAANQRLSQARIDQANAGMDIQTGNAISGLGTGISSNLGAIGRLSSGFGSSSSPGGGNNTGGMGLQSGMQTGSLY